MTSNPLPTVLFLCTGNAARSVIAGAAFAAQAPQVTVETAGTLTVEGQPASFRTKAAMDAVGLDLVRHRSRQVTPGHLDKADLIVALAPEHVAWVRREHPDASPRTATLKRLARDLPLAGPLDQRLSSLDLATVTLEGWEDVEDPAGGEVDAYVACAREIVALMETFVARLGDVQPLGPLDRAEASG